MTSALGAPVEVVNAGVSGYGPDQIEARLEIELPGLKPDLVIVFIYAGNDFGDLMRDKMFKLDDMGNLQSVPFVLDGSLIAQFEKARRGLVLLKIVDYLKLRLNEHFTPQADIERWLRTASEEYEDYVVRGDNTVRDLLADHPDVDVSTDPESPAARYKVRLMEQVLLRIQAICERASAPLLFVFIPSPIDVCDGCDVQHVDRMRFPHYRRSNNTDILQRIAVDHAAQFINLFSRFRDAGAERLYFHRDDHWNDDGQALAAQEVQDYIVRHKLLQERLEAPPSLQAKTAGEIRPTVFANLRRRKLEGIFVRSPKQQFGGHHDVPRQLVPPPASVAPEEGQQPGAVERR